MFRCLPPPKDAYTLVVILREVSEGANSMNLVIGRNANAYCQPTHTTSRSMRCRPLGRELNSTCVRSKSVIIVSNLCASRARPANIPSLALRDQSMILPCVLWNDAWNIATVVQQSASCQTEYECWTAQCDTGAEDRHAYSAGSPCSSQSREDGSGFACPSYAQPQGTANRGRFTTLGHALMYSGKQCAYSFH